MSLTAATIDAMLSAGCTAEQIAAVVKADLAEREKRAEIRRANDAERQRMSRMSRNVTVTPCDIADAPLSPSPLPSPHTPQPTPRPHTPVNIHPARARDADFPMLDCTEPQVWADFLKNRKTKRLPNTATAHAKLVADLTAMAARTGWPPGEVFAACVAKGWGAIYDPRDDEHDRKHGNNHIRRGGGQGAGSGSARSRIADEALAALQ